MTDNYIEQVLRRTNYSVNPNMGGAIGQTVLRSNLVHNPRMAPAESEVVVATNYATRPQGGSGSATASGWGSNNSAAYPVDFDSHVSRSGYGSMRTTRQDDSASPDVAASVYGIGNPYSQAGYPPDPQGEWVASVHVRTTDPSVPLRGRLVLQYRDSVNAVLLTATGQWIDFPSDGEWHAVDVTAPQAPDNTDRISVRGEVQTTDTSPVPVGHKTWITDATLTLNPDVPYFDGDTPDDEQFTYRWTGDPHASASEKVAHQVAGWGPGYSSNSLTYWSPDGVEIVGIRESLTSEILAAPTVFDAEEGAYYAGSFEVRSLDGPMRVQGLLYSNSPNTSLTERQSVEVDQEWTRITLDSADPAGGTGNGRIFLYGRDGYAPGMRVQVRNLLVEEVSGEGESAGEYFDGHSEGLVYPVRWTGEEDNSPSEQFARDISNWTGAIQEFHVDEDQWENEYSGYWAYAADDAESQVWPLASHELFGMRFTVRPTHDLDVQVAIRDVNGALVSQILQHTFDSHDDPPVDLMLIMNATTTSGGVRLHFSNQACFSKVLAQKVNTNEEPGPYFDGDMAETWGSSDADHRLFAWENAVQYGRAQEYHGGFWGGVQEEAKPYLIQTEPKQREPSFKDTFGVEVSYGLEWVSLHDNENFRVDATDFGTQANTRRRIEAQSPFYDGTYLLHSTRENVQETLGVWIYGDSQNDVSENIKLLEEMFSQFRYKVRIRYGNHQETWECYPADYTVIRNHVLMHNQMASMKLQIVRLPHTSVEMLI